jgi:general secretion pathway protein E
MTFSLSDILLQDDIVSQADIDQARRLQIETGGLFSHALLRLGAIAEDDLLGAEARLYGLTQLKTDDLPEDEALYRAARDMLGISLDWLTARQTVVWRVGGSGDDDRAIGLLAPNPLDSDINETTEIQAAEAGCTLNIYLAPRQVIETALDRQSAGALQAQGADDDAGNDAQRLREMAEEAPVIDFVNQIFAEALKEKASDIHIEPFEDRFDVRFRVDGVLHHKQTRPKGQFDAVASRVKLLSGMDIAERRLPQDGRQTIRFAGQDIDLRVSSLPGSWGESLVLRLLTKDSELPNLEALGLEGRSGDVFQSLLSQPNGVILVTGPTGSGKSTTLYRGLQGLNDGIRKIITIEDPVEYDMDGIVQIQTNANIGFSFGEGLRAILRQDPDIIMVGEIRDGETATIAAQAALTGHLVLSTLHTNSALAAIARLIDIGLEPFMIASAVRGLAAQRLVRKLCPHCSTPAKDPAGYEAQLWTLIGEGHDLSASLAAPPAWRDAQGCEHCGQTGYTGRLAIFEVARMTDDLANGVQRGDNLQTLMTTARIDGFLTLLEDGLLKARRGDTSLTEIMRVCGVKA